MSVPRDRADTAPLLPAPQNCKHPEESRRTQVIPDPLVLTVCSRCEGVLTIEREAAAPDAPAPLICAACGGTNEPVVMVPLHPRCTAAPAPQALVRPDRIASALADCPDTADWTLRERDRLAADLHAALARLSRLPSETGDETA